ncbi:hypothetical protein GCM10009738_23450 [Kitasatospora viridis]
MISWVYAFVDRPRERFERAAEFWTAVTGTSLSPRRGADGEFATFVPAAGDAHLKLQGVDAPAGGAHLDLVVDDVAATADRAIALGAALVADHGSLLVLDSPGGLGFCVVGSRGEAVRSEVFEGTRLDQVSIDVAPHAHDAETAFWSELTGWPVLTGSRPEFRAVQSPASLPVRLLIQRLDEPAATRAHLDFSCADVAATRARHEALGAVVVAEFPYWVVLRDPAGGVYCLTSRNPETGRLG